MRDLTLHEKITIKGILSPIFGFSMPKVDMGTAKMWWQYQFGYFPISNYAKLQRKRRSHVK